MNLFDSNITRLKALSFKKSLDKNLNIFVHRNHSFEMIGNVINAFLNFSDIEGEFLYSSYDDSLTFPELSSDIDLHILWLDLSRYNSDVVFAFVKNKIAELRSKTAKPIIVAYLGNELKADEINTSDTYLVNIDKIIDPLEEKAFDLAKEPVSGTRLSAKASVLIAQYLGLHIIPSIVKPTLKAIVLDLDNTLYKGILGEDGVDNLVANNKLQKYLLELKKQGFLLCIASKNEEKDAVEMFNKRTDFELKINDFTTKRINWNSKAGNIVEMAKEMNINPDSMLFIDDNIAEIESVKAAIPQIKTIVATNENTVLNALRLYPGLMKRSTTKEDSLRSADLKANQERAELLKTLSVEDYFKNLGMKVELVLNDREHIDRITELLNKTNQFILSYKRYNKTEVDALLNSANSCILTASMSDKLSDSGIIAILIAKKQDNEILVDELTFSCRALGRNIENIVISKMLLMACEYLKTDYVANIQYKKGPRNTPALTWLAAYTQNNLEKDEDVLKISVSKDIETHGLNIKESVNG